MLDFVGMSSKTDNVSLVAIIVFIWFAVYCCDVYHRRKESERMWHISVTEWCREQYDASPDEVMMGQIYDDIKPGPFNSDDTPPDPR